MVVPHGVRIRWADLPPAVVAGVEDVLGDRVVETMSQVGGFSPGVAERVRTADGRRAFVKAGGLALNEFTPGMYRREIAITAALPPQAPATHLIGSYDDGDWVALVLADVDGRHPHTPWQVAEIDAVAATLALLADELTPVPAGLVVPRTDEELADDFAGWARLRTEAPASVPALAAGHLDELHGLALDGIAAAAGETLVHLDVRSDNLLVRADGSVVLVDWPWASRGARWVDSLALLLNVGLYGGHDPEDLVAGNPVLADAPAPQLTAFLAGLGAYFADISRRPAPPGLPTVREFQRQQGEVVLRWLARRLGW